jgi:hypothetical protein
MAVSHNDIIVLQRSLVFSRLVDCHALMVTYEMNGNPYTKGYHLADGIHPPWSTLVKTIRKPKEEKESMFANKQHDPRKDVERTFGVLQSRWAIIWHPTITWSREYMWEVMTACVIMHKLMIEEEHDDSGLDHG